MQEIISQSVLTCPYCQFKETLIMPTDACQWFHQCPQCDEIIEPKKGDCCVFCSYGTVPCPPIQEGDSCCSKGASCG